MTDAPTTAAPPRTVGDALFDAIRSLNLHGSPPEHWDGFDDGQVARAFLASLERCEECEGTGEVEGQDAETMRFRLYVCEPCNGIGYLAKEETE